MRQQVNVVTFVVEFDQFYLDAGAHIAEDFLQLHQVVSAEHQVPVFGHEH